MGSQLCSGTHTSKRAKEVVSAELNVLAHEARVHPDQLHEERVRDKLLLDRDRVRDDLHDLPLRQTVYRGEQCDVDHIFPELVKCSEVNLFAFFAT